MGYGNRVNDRGIEFTTASTAHTGTTARITSGDINSISNSGDRYLGFQVGKDAVKTDTKLMYLTSESGGRVGIGTESPTQALDVAGDTRLREGLYDGNNAIGTAGQVLSSTSTKTSWITLPASDSEDADGGTKIQVEEGSDDDTIRFDTAGTERAVITSTGSVGIGTASPSSVLDVVASTIARNTGGLEVQHSNGTQGISFGYDGIRKIGDANTNLYLDATGNGNIYFHQNGSTGNVGIGTSTATDKLTVGGDLSVSGSIKQNGSTLHPDYVFENYYEGVSKYNPSYHLPELEDLEVFLAENLHLPGVQSRADIAEKGSWNVSENVRTNLEKIEELFLYTIEQQKKIDGQKATLEAQQNEIDALKDMLQSLLKKDE
jgi:hypothetical protein